MHLDADYLVVGAGAAGLAFTDTLVSEDADATVVVVDRRARPGGHWNDAYPFVRLHQPAAFYGVSSRRLGQDRIDAEGLNAGMYEQSNAPAICAYFSAVMDDTLLGSGRVEFVPMHDWTEVDGRHELVSLLTGEVTTVSARRLVDATYQSTEIPSRHERRFAVADGATVIAPNELVDLDRPADGFVVIGGGKTAMDTVSWLLGRGVDADAIRWIRPRDSWLLNRAYFQPGDMVGSMLDGVALELEAASVATSPEDLLRLLEEAGRLMRFDPEVEPTMYHCATLSLAELEQLRQVTDVVRLGRVGEVGTDRIVLEEGSVPTTPTTVHVDCTAAGLRRNPDRPVFEDGRLTIQQVRACQPTFNAALIAFVEANRPDDGTKNHLCPPNRYPDSGVDLARGLVVQEVAARRWQAEPDLWNWLSSSRLNIAVAMGEHMGDPEVADALGRIIASGPDAVANLERMLAAIDG